MTQRPTVLFICVKNGGKSQMAEALLRHYAGDTVEVTSAGTRPGSAINASSVEAIAEIGADMAAATPQALTPEMLRAADRVIVLGREAVVEPVNGKHATIETWDIDEPSERGIEGMERMRGIRDDIDASVRNLYQELRAGSTVG